MEDLKSKCSYFFCKQKKGKGKCIFEKVYDFCPYLDLDNKKEIKIGRM